MVFLFFSLSFTFTSILFNSIRYFWLPSVGNSIQNYRLLFSLFGFIHSLILISNLKKSDPKGKKEKKNNSSVLGMSYAYLFKYIIIGDTGTPPSLSLSNSNLVFVFWIQISTINRIELLRYWSFLNSLCLILSNPQLW